MNRLITEGIGQVKILFMKLSILKYVYVLVSLLYVDGYLKSFSPKTMDILVPIGSEIPRIYSLYHKEIHVWLCCCEVQQKQPLM